MRITSLTQLIRAQSTSGNTGITFIESHRHVHFLSYAELYQKAMQCLTVLQQHGVNRCDEVILQTEDNQSLLITFWACILGGMIPVPLAMGGTDMHRQKLLNVWKTLNHPYLMSSTAHYENIIVNTPAADNENIKKRYINEAQALSPAIAAEPATVNPEDIAFIQFSSGSTGSPKGVVLTHANLIANIQGISTAARYTAADATLSWMPLTHDMGMIGFHLNPLLQGMNQYLMPTNLFVRRPALWMEALSRYKATITCSPNFGYRYFLKHFTADDHHDWDLSGVRIIYNGAEPIAASICNEFTESMKRFGLKAQAMRPVYGLAEASVAVTISDLHTDVITMMVNRHQVNINDKVMPVSEAADAVSFVDVGKPVDGCLLRIADDNDAPVDAGIIGHIHIKGENVTSGYYNNAAASGNVRTADGWLKTGDLGFLSSQGSLFVTGRAKDIIFVNGQNFYPHDIERMAEEIDTIELNKIAVGGFFNNDTQKDEVIAFVLHRGELAAFLPIAAALKKLVNTQCGFEIDHVIPVKNIPRTTSGKLQRFKLVSEYLEGNYKAIMDALYQLTAAAADRVELFHPATPVEQQLAVIWRKVLKRPHIFGEGHFFENGGDSLKASEVCMLVKKELGAELSLEVFYGNATIPALATEIASLESTASYDPIPRTAPARTYALSAAQKRMYYTWEADQTATTYNVPVVLKIAGPIDRTKLASAIAVLISRHEALRMSFNDPRQPVCTVHDTIAMPFEYITSSPENADQLLRELITPFNLHEAPLFKIRLINIAEQQHLLLLDFHHIICDGVSANILIQELFDCYAGHTLPPIPVNYRDYTEWERRQSDQRQTLFWKQQLASSLPVLDLPTDFSRPVVYNSAGTKLEVLLDKDITASLSAIAVRYACSMNTLLFTLYSVLLSKYSGQQQVAIGIAAAGRTHPDLLGITGMFVNSLPVISDITAGASFPELLEKHHRLLTAVLHHQDYPFEKMIRQAAAPADASRNRLFDTMFVFQNVDYDDIDTADLHVQRHFFDPGIAKFDITMEVFHYGQTLQCAIEYNTSLFKKETAEQMARHFKNLVKQIAEKPDCYIDEMTLPDGTEYEDIIHRFNDTVKGFPRDVPIHELIRQQAEATPEAVALEYGNETFTYRQLDEQAGRLSFLLRRSGIGTESIVAVLMDRRPGLIVAILAVLKAGACFLPIDLATPVRRISYMLSDSGANMLITDNSVSTLEELNPLLAELPELTVLDTGMVTLPDDVPVADHPAATATDLAYIIYTSGTTGNPKGVMVEHRSLVNYITWAADTYVKEADAAFPLFTSISFDLTITTLFVPLVTGNRMVIYSAAEDEFLMKKVLLENKVTVVKATPSHLVLMASCFSRTDARNSRIKRFIVGGEQLTHAVAAEIQQLFGDHIEICNEYGPTETTVGCMIQLFNPADSGPVVPIGTPAANTRIYLLDNALQPVPAGVKGELYISGEGVARGYLGSPELTAQKFIADPFAAGLRMYRTGDIARRLASGLIEYLGRKDKQLKISGHRIDLTEIEHQLSAYEGIASSVAVIGEGRKAPVIIAYYIASGTHRGIDEPLLRAYLAKRLPYYAIPAYFMPLDAYPLTANGKVDHAALPAITLPEENAEQGDARDEIFITTWNEVFGVDNITAGDNFFELGGDSIKAIQILSRLADEGFNLSVKDILTYQTIRQINANLLRTETVQEYEQGYITGSRGLLPIEAWFFDQDFQRPGFYNHAVTLTFHEEIDVHLLQQSFQALVRQHDGVRINYDPQAKTLFYNPLHTDTPFTLAQYDVDAQGREMEAICMSLKSSFDISGDLLLKAAVFSMAGDRRTLFITAHHLIVDGISWRILLKDLYTAYKSLQQHRPVKFPAKTATARQWREALLRYPHPEGDAAGQLFWQSVENVPFSLPLEKYTADWRMVNAAHEQCIIDKKGTKALLQLARQVFKTDAAILLNAAVALAIRDWTGKHSCIIEQENHGRYIEQLNVSRTVGWFTGMYPQQLKVPDGSLEAVIWQIRQQMDHTPGKGLGYGILRYLHHALQVNRTKLSDIRLNYLGQLDQEFDNDLYTYSGDTQGGNIAPDNVMTAKLELNVIVLKNTLEIDIQYNRLAYEKATIQAFAGNLVKWLRHMVAYGDFREELPVTTFSLGAGPDGLDDDELSVLFN